MPCVQSTVCYGSVASHIPVAYCYLASPKPKAQNSKNLAFGQDPFLKGLVCKALCYGGVVSHISNPYFEYLSFQIFVIWNCPRGSHNCELSKFGHFNKTLFLKGLECKALCAMAV